MTMLSIGLLAAFLILLALGVPVAFAMAISGTAVVVAAGYPPDVVVHRTIIGMDDFLLVAIPLFILAAAIMEKGDISSRLMTLLTGVMGRFKSGLPNSIVVAEMFFSGISGSTVADISAVSAMTVKPMERRGFRRSFTLAVVSASSAFGILIPPCILMVVMAAMVNSSVLAVFVAGLLPALLLGVMTMAMVVWRTRRQEVAAPVTQAVPARQIARAAADCGWALGLPVLIFGGVVLGVATATEIAAVADLYSLFVAVVIYRSLSLAALRRCLIETGVATGALAVLFGFATIVSFLLARFGVPAEVATLAAGLTESSTIIMLIFALVFVVMGSVLEGMPAVLIFVPVLFPVASEFGVHPVHFQIVVVTAIGIGLFLPPSGLGLLIASQIGQTPVPAVTRELAPFLAVLLVGLAMLAAFPLISTVVPSILGVR
ncbi:MAG: TRAP transporter large permease subunit [Streptosporangiales bacterium]|nr:TRAP transporter large permease subunit [Streptosporangiales bacterium]